MESSIREPECDSDGSMPFGHCFDRKIMPQVKNLLTNLGSTSLSELVEDGPIVGVPLSPVPPPYEEN